METPKTTQAPAESAAEAPKTDAERYPLITDPTYRRCVDAIIFQVEAKVNSLGGADNIKSCAAKQLIKAGNLNADFCLAHFAGIFDGKSPLSSAQRRFIKAILTDAAVKLAELKMAAQEAAKKQEAKKETLTQAVTRETAKANQEGGQK